MAKPESTEALLNPSLRVSRPVAACARCRSAKIKCDGKLPGKTSQQWRYSTVQDLKAQAKHFRLTRDVADMGLPEQHVPPVKDRVNPIAVQPQMTSSHEERNVAMWLHWSQPSRGSRNESTTEEPTQLDQYLSLLSAHSAARRERRCRWSMTL